MTQVTFDVSQPTIEIALDGPYGQMYQPFVNILKRELKDVRIGKRSLEVVEELKPRNNQETNGLIVIRVLDLTVNLADLYKAINRAQALMITYHTTEEYHSTVGRTAVRPIELQDVGS